MDDVFKRKTVLVAGGATGVGTRCCSLFARLGAQVISAGSESAGDEDAPGAGPANGIPVSPLELGQAADVRAFLRQLRERCARVDILVTCFTEPAEWKGSSFLDESAFVNDMKETGWPFFELFFGIVEQFNSAPGHSVVILEDSPGERSRGTVVARSVIEILSRYLATHHLSDRCRINVLKVHRPGAANASGPSPFTVSDEDAARTAVTLCSGLFDAVSGQTISVDQGLECMSAVSS